MSQWLSIKAHRQFSLGCSCTPQLPKAKVSCSAFKDVVAVEACEAAL